MRMRLLQTRNLVLIALSIAAYGSQACSSNDQDDMGVAQKTTQASSVSIHLEDSSGNDIGSCAGTLVAEKLVLTAGHCVVSASTWRVEGAGKVVTAQRAVTPWKQFNSTLSHPKHADIALLVLDDAIKIARYPSIASEGLKDGAKATRMHRSASGSKEFISTNTVVKDGTAKGFHLAYTAEMPKDEWLDTGGALFDSKGKIYGVVSAQGKQSSLLYITRVEGFNQWLTGSVDECGESGNGLAVRTWGSGGWGGSSSGGSGGWGGGGDWGGYGGAGKKLEAGAPPSSVDAGTGTGGGTGSGMTNGGSGSTDGGAGTGTGGGDGSGTGGGDGSKSGTSGPPGPNENGEVGAGANSGATCPPKPPSSSSIPGGTGGAGSEGSGTNGSSTNGANPGGSTGTGAGGGTGSGTGGGDGTGTGTGGGTGGGDGTGTGTGTGGGSGGSTTGAPGSAGLDEEVCEGAEDNPAICPPDGPQCSGPSCGGCAGVASCVDGTMDYGNCACEAPASTIGNPDGLR